MEKDTTEKAGEIRRNMYTGLGLAALVLVSMACKLDLIFGGGDVNATQRPSATASVTPYGADIERTPTATLFTNTDYLRTAQPLTLQAGATQAAEQTQAAATPSQ